MKRADAIALTTILLCLASVSMITAWYFHLKMKSWKLWQAYLVSVSIASIEYLFLVPANRIGHEQGALSTATLRSVSEMFIIIAYLVFQVIVLKEPLKVNHVVGFLVVLLGVVVVVAGPFPKILIGGERTEDAQVATKVENDAEAQPAPARAA